MVGVVSELSLSLAFAAEEEINTFTNKRANTPVWGQLAKPACLSFLHTALLWQALLDIAKYSLLVCSANMTSIASLSFLEKDSLLSCSSCDFSHFHFLVSFFGRGFIHIRFISLWRIKICSWWMVSVLIDKLYFHCHCDMNMQKNHIIKYLPETWWIRKVILFTHTMHLN